MDCKEFLGESFPIIGWQGSTVEKENGEQYFLSIGEKLILAITIGDLALNNKEISISAEDMALYVEKYIKENVSMFGDITQNKNFIRLGRYLTASFVKPNIRNVEICIIPSAKPPLALGLR